MCTEPQGCLAGAGGTLRGARLAWRGNLGVSAQGKNKGNYRLWRSKFFWNTKSRFDVVNYHELSTNYFMNCISILSLPRIALRLYGAK